MFHIDRRTWFIVLVGALGYFVDIYDLVLFGMLRVASLKSLAVPDSQLLDTGVLLLNTQMVGMLLGGILWGMLGDKKGRLKVLFGSILLYSIANILNGFVTTVEAYAVMRFIAGFGLAGELGAAITLVSEVLPTKARGYGTAIVAAIGLSGAVVAGLTAELVGWRQSYWIGGALGMGLLVLRLGTLESGLFQKMASDATTKRGKLSMLFLNPGRAKRYLFCICVGIPIWYCAGIIMTFSPELGKALGTDQPLVASRAIMISYVGVVIGDLVTGVLSQLLKSRKKVVLVCMACELVITLVILNGHGITSFTFYVLCFVMGLATGYWAVFVTMAAEQFGTNLRATVTTSVPNFVRGSVIPMTLAFRSLGNQTSFLTAAILVGIIVHCIGFFGTWGLDETHSRDLAFFEH